MNHIIQNPIHNMKVWVLCEGLKEGDTGLHSVFSAVLINC